MKASVLRVVTVSVFVILVLTGLLLTRALAPYHPSESAQFQKFVLSEPWSPCWLPKHWFPGCLSDCLFSFWFAWC